MQNTCLGTKNKIPVIALLDIHPGNHIALARL